MTVGQLRALLVDLDPEVPVLLIYEAGTCSSDAVTVEVRDERVDGVDGLHLVIDGN